MTVATQGVESGHMKAKTNEVLTRAAFFIREDRLRVSHDANHAELGGVKGFQELKKVLQRARIANNRLRKIESLARRKDLSLLDRPVADTLEASS